VVQIVSAALDRCWVNLYLPAAVDDPATGVRLTLAEPVPGSARMTVHRLGSRDLHLRVPRWAERIEASRAGRTVEGKPGADGYLVLAGPWQPDEQVEVRLVPRAGVERCPDDPTLVAVTSVPYVLAARTEATTVLEVDLDRVTAAVRAVAAGEPVTVDGVRPGARCSTRPAA
jgi:DUF1680 family protein